MHPEPESVLFLGVASGVTVGSATYHSGLAIHGVEVLPEILRVLPAFERFNERVYAHPRVRLTSGDARRVLRHQPGAHDVIIGDLFHPARDGAGLLYTLEHFLAVREALTDDGLFCQWLPLYQLDATMVRSIVATFQEVFPEAGAILAQDDVRYPALGLVSYWPRLVLAPDYLGKRQAALTGNVLETVELATDHELASRLLFAPEALSAWSQGAALNLRHHPIVQFEAPAFTYRRGRAGYESLRQLLTDVATFRPPDLPELAAHLDAREHYLDGLMAESEGQLKQAFASYRRARNASGHFEAASERLDALSRDDGAALLRRAPP